MTYRKSSYSASLECVEAGDFRKSSYSRKTNCVEIAAGIRVRDSKQGEDSLVLEFSPAAWREFLTRISLRTSSQAS